MAGTIMAGTKGGVSLERVERMIWPFEVIEWWSIARILIEGPAEENDDG